MSHKRPRWNLIRATLVVLMKRYLKNAHRIGLVEIGLLCYFLKVAGEKLPVHFYFSYWGPSGRNLDQEFAIQEGHFTRGYVAGQAWDESALELLPEAGQAAEKFLERHSQTRKRLDRVFALVESYQTPSRLELLAGVHWVTTRNGRNSEFRAGVLNADQITAMYPTITARTHNLFKEKMVRQAWHHLEAKQWLTA